MKGFKACQEKHSKISKTTAPIKAMAIQNATLMDFKEESKFFYDQNECKAKVIGIFDQDFNKIDKVIPDKHNWIVLDQTVIYANCGGEVSDWGWIEVGGNKLKVYDAIKGPNGQHFHSIIGTKGLDITIYTNVIVSLDLKAKNIIAATHTCEHLMQAALQQTVSKEIKQMGALKNHHKLTFDFQYHKKLTDEQLDQVEDLINKWIKQALPTTTHMKTLQEAQAMGALAYFEEVYAKVKGKLRVVQVGNVSIEICAGRHVANTKDIGQFHILKLTSKGSGAWRIEAIASNENTIATINELNSELETRLANINKQVQDNEFKDEIVNKIKQIKLSQDWKQTKVNKITLDQLEKEFDKALTDFKVSKVKKEVNDFVNNLKVNEDQPYNVIILNNASSSFIFNLPRTLLDKYQNNGFVILNITDKLSYIVCKSAKAKVEKANVIINELNKITSGRGGGKDTYAQGSTPNINNQDKIVEYVKTIK